MSLLLDDLIKQSRADAEAYEQFLKDAEALAKRLVARQPDAGLPAALHGNHAATVVFHNLPRILTAGLGGASVSGETGPDREARLSALALEIDKTMRERAPAGWKGDPPREAQVLNALFPLMDRNRDATLALFDLVKNQPGY